MHPVRIAVVLLALCSTGAMSQATVATGTAVRATRAPELDGRDDDEVWRLAPVIDRGWRQFDPAEDGEPTLRTEAKVAYDDRNLYVLVRAYDPHPDSIVSLLSRRDVRTNSDQIKIIIDAYHDRRTGVEFAVSPGGVKRDASIYNDVIEDLSWDGVWDAGTRVDSLGWIAEFRIPFSQLRFGKQPAHTFGFGIWRDIARSNERIGWPVYRTSRPTLASQLGELNGIADISRSGRLELLPYVVTKNITEQVGPSAWDHPQKITAGADIKYGVTSTMTLDATVNPDFGQVEADPAVLNLTAFEVRFEERRPFFQEGVGLFRCNGPCEGIFYTRRIGRVPQLRTSGADPTFTSILGAAKLTGRLGNGLSVGLVEAVTSREVGARGTVEPQTNYLVGRIYKELREGRSGVGAMLTGVNRDLDPSTEDLLRRDAYTLLFQGFHRFAGERFELMGYSGLNRVTGTEEAIARTQLSSVHLFQRPDHEERFDPTRTRMEGVVTALQFQKLGGTVQYSTYLRHATPSAELNDLGFVTLVNSMSMRNNVSMRTSRPGSFYRRLQADVGTYSDWTTGGLQQAMSANASVFAELTNSWQTYATVGVENVGATHCVSCARGGPALRLSPTNQLEMGVDGDRRRVLIPHLYYRYSRGDDGRSATHGSSASVDYRLASRFSMSIGAVYDRVTDDQQWLDNYDDPLDGTSSFTFARMRNTTASLTSRLNFTATNTLSSQLYLQPFVSTGAFSNWRELDQPRASDRDERFRPFAGAGPVSDFDFNSKQFNSNLVARWEYRPGSTLFVVWQQGRLENELNPGSFRFGRDYRNLFGAHPDNVLLVKASYWLGL